MWNKKFKKIFFVFLSYFLIIWNVLAQAPKLTTNDKGLTNDTWDGSSVFIEWLKSIFSKDTLFKVFLALVVIIWTIIITKIVRVKLNHILAKQSDWEDWKEEVFWMITRTVNTIILISGFSLALWILGVDLGLFMWWIWFWIWFTLKTFLTNFVWGIIMVMNGEYTSGMLIEIWWKKWRIVKVNALMTELEQFDWVRFLVPNIKFLEEYVSNFDSNDKRRVEVYVTLDYKTDILKAKMIATKVMNSLPGILQAPEASVIITDLWDNWIRLRVQAWISSKDNYFKVRSNIAETLNLAFRKAEIKIAYPQITVSNRND
jgi:small conductance mechanosensitive channel